MDPSVSVGVPREALEVPCAEVHMIAESSSISTVFKIGEHSCTTIAGGARMACWDCERYIISYT
eukprot:3373888-Amphidinium_carterae.3